MVQVYREPLCRRYYGSILGEAFLFRFSAYVAAIVLAFVIAFSTGGFWLKLKADSIQPEVHYTYDALIYFQGATASDVSFWSSSPVLSAGFADSYVAANVQAAEQDFNDDGKPDVITLKVQAAPSHAVHGVQVLLQFQYKLAGTVRLDMYGLGYYTFTSGTPGAALFADGELVFAGKNQIEDRMYNSQYNTPILSSTRPAYTVAPQPTLQLQVQDILKSYLDRNYTTMYSNVYPVWQAGSASPSTFQLEMRIRVPPNQVIYYRPQVIEMLKGGWIQWLATYLVLWWLLQWAEWLVFHFRLLSVRVTSDFTPKTQRF